MKNLAALLIPIFLTVSLLRLLLRPMGSVLKLLLHAGCGFLCLWALNTVSGFTGILLPINAVTVGIAGILGVPGIGLIVLLEILV